MIEEERDIVEFTDEEGNTLLLEVVDSFFYNGEEFAVLADVEAEGCECEGCEGDCAHEHEHEHEESLYIMKVEQSVDEDGEEIEEFVPVEESLMEALIEVVQTRLMADDDDEDDEDEEAKGDD